MITIREIMGMCVGVKPSGDGFYSRCPAHGDSHASLSVRPGERGIVIKCHAGCTIEQICDALQISVKELFEDNREGASFAQKGASISRIAADIATSIDYRLLDINSQCQAIHRRLEFADGSKTFHWLTADGKSGLGGKRAAELPLYLTQMVPTYSREEPIFVVEGEKCADVLLELGLQVVGTTCGANNSPGAAPISVLRGYRVVLWPDNDDVGIEHMKRIAYTLDTINTVYGMVEPAQLGLQNKEDCADLVQTFRDNGNTDEQVASAIMKCIEGAGRLEVAPKARRLSEIVAANPRPRKVMIGPIRERDLVEIYAARGIGKTHFGLSMAYALATGQQFLHWECSESRRVLYIDGEMQITDVVDRIRLYKKTFKVEPGENLSILSNDLIDGYIPSLSSIEGQKFVDDEVFHTRDMPYEVVFMDNVSTLFGGQENDSEAWESAHRWLLSLRKRGVCVIFMHHAGKNGSQRGTSRREDILDMVIKLAPHDPRQSVGQQVPALRDNWGACFEILFEKSRGVHGNLIKPMMAGLHNEIWKMFDLEA